MSDLIRREDAIEALGECPFNWTDTSAEIQEVRDWEYHKACIEAVDAVDAVSVVRCKDCKHWWNEYGDSACMLHSDFTVNADDFCSHGEREGE